MYLKEAETIAKKLSEETKRRMKGEVEINESKESLLIKSDDFALICVKYKKVRQKSKIRRLSKNKPKSLKRKK